MIEKFLEVLTSAFPHSYVNLCKCEMCATEFCHRHEKQNPNLSGLQGSRIFVYAASCLCQPTVCTGIIIKSDIAECWLYLAQSMKPTDCHRKTQWWCQVSFVSGHEFL